jgi:hypothetical protein
LFEVLPESGIHGGDDEDSDESSSSSAVSFQKPAVKMNKGREKWELLSLEREKREKWKRRMIEPVPFRFL